MFRKNERFSSAQSRARREVSIPKSFPGIDTDLARDNLENDFPAADLEDL